jgi:hypothetical protein
MVYDRMNRTDRTSEGKENKMDENRDRLIDEIEEQAIQYDMEYTG